MIRNHDFTSVEVLAYQQAKDGSDCCGDSYFVTETKEYFVCAVADGLGSGKLAKESSQAAISATEQFHDGDLETIIQEANKRVKGKRGAVLAILKIDFVNKQMLFSGIGNINLVVYNRKGLIARPISKSGYLSGNGETFQTQTIPLDEPILFLMHSDGLTLLSSDEELFAGMEPTDIAYVLKRYITTASDDITCLIGKMTSIP